ncbi:MAG: hypothetical protein ABIP93_01430 [Gemmatimonadaceae bacterium]
MDHLPARSTAPVSPAAPAPPVEARSTLTRVAPLVALLAALSIAGCGADVAAPTAPTSAPRRSVGTEAVDLSGTWAWSETVAALFPPFIAQIVGIEPEGPVTHATCYDWGVLTLVQTGDTFTGTATQSSICTTKGGQEYVPPSFPPLLDVLNGQIRGRSFSFDFSVGCPYSGTVSLDGGVATRIGGTGRCEVFLHPALLKTVSWQATRL